jgi:hypothetical protein
MSRIRCLFYSVVLTALVLGFVPSSVEADPPPTLGAQAPSPIVYVLAVMDTESENNHPTDSYHTVFDVYNYVRPTEECGFYETQYSASGSSWTTYAEGTVFNFLVKPAGEGEAVASSTCGDDNGYGLDDFHRAVRFRVPEDGYYDVQVQISYVGDPPDTHIHVVGDDSGHPDTTSPPLSTFTASTSTVANGEYNTIAQDLWLEGGVLYWWYAERQSGGSDFDEFAVYRGGAGGGGTTISHIMGWDFRTTHADSFGNPFKMSWSVEMDNYVNQGQFADGTPFDYLTLYNLLMENWSEEVEGWGDEIAYHHHFMYWDGSNWVQPANLTGYDWHNEALDTMVLEGGFFPSAFRTGWLWTNNQLQSWIEDWMLVDYTNEPGTGPWIGAPTSWFPYHPSPSDYRVPGDMNHWIARCNIDPSQSTVDLAFAEAQSSGGPVIYCWYAHKRDGIRGRIVDAQSYLEAAEQAYGVPFEYATATEAVQAIMGCTDTTPPVLSIAAVGEGTYRVASDEPLWGVHPYVAAKYRGVSGEVYTHTLATSVGTNVWEAPVSGSMTLPIEPHEVITVTASDEHAEHPASHAVDGNRNSYWDSTPEEVPAWVQVDLGEEKEVEKLTIHFWDGDSRTYTYYVEGSTDGADWSEIVSSNTVHGVVTHVFDPAISVRHARLTVTANSSATSDYAHVREIALYGGPAPEQEVLYLQEVGAGALDLCGNSAVITHTIKADLSIAKKADPPIVYGGDTVTYTYTVTNPGDGPLGSIAVTDDECSPVSGPGEVSGDGDSVLDPGEEWTYTCTTTLSVDTTNLATATGTDLADGRPVTDTATAYVDVIAPAIQGVVEASTSTVHVGEIITYTYTVKNVGDVILTDVSAGDDRLGPIGLAGDVLMPGEVVTGTATYLVDQSDLPGPIISTVTVTGTPPAGDDVIDTDTATVYLEEFANIVYLPFVKMGFLLPASGG